MPTTPIDLDMCASDMADMLDKYGYADVCGDAIRPELERFLAAITERQQHLDEQEATRLADAMTWTASDGDADPAAEPVPQRSRRPRTTYMDWQRSQLVNLGATARDEWYWQCPTTGCKVWAGPYPDPITAKQAGFQHVYRCEKTDYHRRGRRS
ncbi:MAG: hypothetical protein V7603_5042 [Micromonosporaceae bacterium]